MCNHHNTRIDGDNLICEKCGETLVNLVQEREMHWSERDKYGYIMQPRQEYELGDQMGDHSDQQEYEPLEMED